MHNRRGQHLTESVGDRGGDRERVVGGGRPSRHPVDPVVQRGLSVALEEGEVMQEAPLIVRVPVQA